MDKPSGLVIAILHFCFIHCVEANLLAESDVRLPERPGGRHCSNQFCIESDYQKLELPPPNNGSSVQVIITPHILEIFEVSHGVNKSVFL